MKKSHLKRKITIRLPVTLAAVGICVTLVSVLAVIGIQQLALNASRQEANDGVLSNDEGLNYHQLDEEEARDIESFENLVASQTGYSSDGEVFETPDEAWQTMQGSDGSHHEWYESSVAYWDAQETSDTGVLQGYIELSEPDLRDSREFLLSMFDFEQHAQQGRPLVALDCAAGVGRVTRELLIHLYDEVDLLEPAPRLLEKAKEELAKREAAGAWPTGHQVVNYYQTGLQHHTFERYYDTIWIQWALYYMTDEDVVYSLQSAALALNPDGIIFVKENVVDEGFVVDRTDGSVTRSQVYLEQLFISAGLQVVASAVQSDFAPGLYEVRMWVLTPRAATEAW